MKFYPILFSTEMVQANDEDIKTQSRRTKGLKVINQNPDDYVFERFQKYEDGSFRAVFFNGDEFGSVKFPYGKPGDVLWVKETFQIVPFKDAASQFLYKANPEHQSMKWKLSLFMPKDAARLFLLIKDIRVERLKDISESDAIAEGIKMTWISDNPEECKFKNYINNGRGSLLPVDSFLSLWESINGKASLDLNPWVWVIEFEKINKPENFNI
jgi:hypothetical protein